MDFYNDFVIFNRCEVSLNSKQSIQISTPFVCVTESSNNPQLSGFNANLPGCHFLFLINKSDKEIIILNNDEETPENQRIKISTESNIPLGINEHLVAIYDGENYLIKV